MSGGSTGDAVSGVKALLATLVSIAGVLSPSTAHADMRLDRKFVAAIVELCEPSVARGIGVADIEGSADMLAPTTRFPGVGDVFPGAIYQYRGSGHKVIVRQAETESCVVVQWARLGDAAFSEVVLQLEQRGYQIFERGEKPTGANFVTLGRYLSDDEAIAIQLSQSKAEPIADASVLRVRRSPTDSRSVQRE